MAASPPVQVSAAAITGATGKYRPDDNLVLTLTFEDGSIGNIIYTAKGSKAFSRERFEVFCEDSVAVIEDFRRVQIVKGGRVRKISKFSMDLGYRAEMEFFLRPKLKDVGDYGKLFSSYISSTRTTLRADEALRLGRPLSIAAGSEAALGDP